MPNPINSVLKLKCPKCRQGDLFYNKKIYQFKGFFDMPKKCPKCGQDFQIETGFYYGAMYVSYALTIALIVAVFTVLIVFNIFSIELFLLLDFIVLLIALPYLFKVSRSIWIALMVKFDKKAIEKYERKA
ncbi:MAG: hypothetical protein A3K10_14455 [Bacteroidetes bacterium RIFCSPLOWO2_12_FULL_31_6]|nr:MAG: hypothetical protein A3K10_14455 [Bacteroidetes bacterium RIFCSPLOWO2_12_FULL_31_6]